MVKAKMVTLRYQNAVSAFTLWHFHIAYSE